MTRFNSEYTVKNNPSPNDRLWGLDLAGNSNVGIELKKILELGDHINVKNFGAVGSGLVDDRDAINQAATFAASAGKTLYFPSGSYFVSNSVNLPAGTRIHAYGAKIFNLGSHIYLMNVNSNTIIKGLELEGAGANPSNTSGRGINFVGIAGSYKSELIIEDCFIHDIGFYGIYCQFVSDYTIKNTKVFDIGYTGIMGLSVSNSYINYCYVKNIDYLEGGYGISFTRETIVDTLFANPRSINCTVENCLVENNLQWKAYDTHGGDNIRFINNTAINCRQGIGIVSAGNFAPKNCKVLNNYIITNRGAIDYTWGAYGIVVAGVVDEDLSTSVDFAINNDVVGNILIGCGMENNANEGAIRVRNTINTKIQNNTIDKPFVTGISIQNTNYNFSVSNNLIEDPNTSNTSLNTVGILVSSQYNVGNIIENVMYRRNPALNTKVSERAINVSTALNNKLIIKNNLNNFLLDTNIPLSFDIITDNYHNKTLRINRPSSESNQQILFNEEFSIYADNTGGLNLSDPVSAWLTGRTGTTVFISPRSGGPFHWVGINAETVDITSGRLRIAGSTATLESSGIRQNVDGLAESGNVFKNGIHYTTISEGLANNYPENTGLSIVTKSENSRILEYFANTTGTLWYRCLTTASNNIWKKVLTDDYISNAYTQTTDPLVSGQLWNNGGVLTFSNG